MSKMLSEPYVNKLRQLNQLLEELMFDKEFQDEMTSLGTVSVVNPAVLFTKYVKSGYFDGVNDEDYAKFLKNAEDAVAVFESVFGKYCVADIRYIPKYYQFAEQLQSLHEVSSVLVRYGDVIAELNAIFQKDGCPVEHYCVEDSCDLDVYSLQGRREC